MDVSSEHGAGFETVLMHRQNASKNAGDMINRFQILYNRTRQAVITGELVEIIVSSLSSRVQTTANHNADGCCCIGGGLDGSITHRYCIIARRAAAIDFLCSIKRFLSIFVVYVKRACPLGKELSRARLPSSCKLPFLIHLNPLIITSLRIRLPRSIQSLFQSKLHRSLVSISNPPLISKGDRRIRVIIPYPCPTTPP